MSDVLDGRTLNRTTLHRQHLLERVNTPVEDMVEHLVGMQAQNPLDPYFGMWGRLEDFDSAALGSLVSQGAAVRGQLMRGTIHLVTAEDWNKLRPVFDPLCARILGSTQYGKATKDIDRPRLLEISRRLFADRPMTRASLGPLLERQFPGVPADSLAQTATYLLPVVQTPPRGVWGETGQASWSLLDPGEVSPTELEDTKGSLVLRYLAAFGPASVKDIRAWSGLTGLAAAVDRVRPQLHTYVDQHGTDLLDIAEGVIRDGEVHTPPRFLPEYDNLLLGHADRSRFFAAGGPVPPGWAGNLLVDGTYAGHWKRDGASGVIDLTLQRKVTSRQRREVTEEAERLQDAIRD